MQVFITNKDGSMFVHEMRGVVFVTWVSKINNDKALRFPADQAGVWAKIISEMTGIECVTTTPRRPGAM